MDATLQLVVPAHPLLDLHAFVTRLPAPLVDLKTPDSVLGFFQADAPAPLTSSDEVRSTIRDLLRHGGYRPTGRGKPASEYLIRAAGEGTLSSINLVVDVCNAVSLHSGLPISVVDVDLLAGDLQADLRVDIAAADAAYVFNRSGQTMDVGGLICLADAEGPCANAVKDSQRTKTSDQTTRTLSLIWGSNRLPGRTAETAAWYHQLLAQSGAEVEVVTLS